MKKPVIVLGAGGHASVLIELLLKLDYTILGVCAPQASIVRGYPQISYLGQDSILNQHSPNEVRLVNGIGAISAEKNRERQKLFEHYKQLGFEFETLIHPHAIVADTALIKEGAQVMAGSIIQANTIIESNCIVNTGACIDHDCHLGHSVHVAPRAVLSGNVKLGENVMVGVGAVIIQSVSIAQNMMIRAGSTVVKSRNTQALEDI